ncbi:hypothetical protein B0H12DRAFT_1070581 [Mycena haematopus]|nr:hypothetical protein B0H12DRAFT_1070581 [Mycena haematopus]
MVQIAKRKGRTSTRLFSFCSLAIFASAAWINATGPSLTRSSHLKTIPILQASSYIRITLPNYIFFPSWQAPRKRAKPTWPRLLSASRARGKRRSAESRDDGEARRRGGQGIWAYRTPEEWVCDGDAAARGSDGWRCNMFIGLIDRYGLETEIANYLSHNHGAVLHSPLAVIEAEVPYAVRHEYALTPIDVLPYLAVIIAAELNWSAGWGWSRMRRSLSEAFVRSGGGAASEGGAGRKGVLVYVDITAKDIEEARFRAHVDVDLEEFLEVRVLLWERRPTPV